MHFEFLTEDQSGKIMLDLLLPQLLPLAEGHTYNVHYYKGIGRIPKGMKPSSDANKRILLDQLPRLLAGYGKTFESYGKDYLAVVIIICDLDTRDRRAFEKELHALAESVRPSPAHAFCLAVEEGEAWLLGDLQAIKTAYPEAKQAVLKDYENDSICGTWELMANAVYSGGAEALKEEGWMRIGEEKTLWAMKITPHMNLHDNHSPSFNCFISEVLGFTML